METDNSPAEWDSFSAEWAGDDLIRVNLVPFAGRPAAKVLIEREEAARLIEQLIVALQLSV